MEEIYKRKALWAVQEEAKKDFIARARSAEFTTDQALFLWNFLVTSETMKKMMNLVEHLQKEKDFKM